MRFFGDNSVLRKLSAFINRSYRRTIVWIVCIAVVSAFMETGIVAIAMGFMNVILLPDTILDAHWAERLYVLLRCDNLEQLIIFICIVLAAGYIIKDAWVLYVNRVKLRFHARASANLSVQLFDCYMHKPYAYHCHKNSAEILKSTTTDVEIIFNLIMNLLSLLSESSVTLCLLVFMLVVNWKLSLLAGVMIGLIVMISSKLVMGPIRRASWRTWAASANKLKWVSQSLGGLKGIYVNRRQQYCVNEFSDASQESAEASSRASFLSYIPDTAVDALCMAGIFIIIIVLIATGTDLYATLPVLGTFAVVAVRLIPAMRRISRAYTGASRAVPSLEVVCEAFRDSGVDLRSTACVKKDVPARADTQPLTKGVEVSHLRFTYQDAPSPLFEDVSLTIPAQKSVAFVGKTGEGKTTLADIILGLYRPDAGTVTADGRSVHDEPEWWARRVGYVPQAVYLSDDTIRANVAFGFAEKDMDEAQIWKCLDDAQMKEFVESLPEGLNTRVGEKGVRLSGGQQQRIGIARALYGRPRFLIMDEATSSLDGETEKAIIESIDRLYGRITILIIAHRLTTIKNCDLVYRVENKTVTLERSGREKPAAED